MKMPLSPDTAYAKLKRIRDICLQSESEPQVRALVREEFPEVSDEVLTGLSFYANRFNPKGSRHVRQR